MTCTIIQPLELNSRLPRMKMQSIPFVTCNVAAGFPSPADDHFDKSLNLNDWLIKHEAATFLVRASGYSMRDIGILDNDVLIVDRSIKAIDGSVIVAAINGECLVKIFRQNQSNIWLQAANPEFPAIHLSNETLIEVWGVVIGVARQHGSNGRVCSN